MAKLASWDEQRRGVGCPFDSPRPDYSEFLYLVRKLSVSSLYLSREQTYRGACALIYDPRHVVRIDELSRNEWADLSFDLWTAECAIYEALSPDHVNIESLGSTVPHLHWHIIPRYKNDGRWGGPIWTTRHKEMPSKTLSESEYQEIASAINAAIDNDV